MSFAIIIFLRLLFLACMVFIIGYVFGNFSKKPILRTVTKFAAILAIVLFISANVFFFQFAESRYSNHSNEHGCSLFSKRFNKHQVILPGVPGYPATAVFRRFEILLARVRLNFNTMTEDEAHGLKLAR